MNIYSEHNKDAVLYSLRYRCGSGIGDDEKESEWKEEVLDNGVDEYKLNGLSIDSRYQLAARYKLLETMSWSEYSDIVCIVTPKFQFPKFEWDSARKHADIVLSNENQTMSHVRDQNWRTVIAKPELSSESMLSVSWEITIRNIGKLGYLHIGFVDSDIVDQVKLEATCFGTSVRPKEFALGISSGVVSRYQNGTEAMKFNNWTGSDLKAGDRLLFTMNFEKSTITVHYNGNSMGVLSEALPHRLYVAANAYTPITLETTRFEITPR